MGDAPPHGKENHEDDVSDDYQDGHQKDVPLENLFKEVDNKQILYFFGKNPLTNVTRCHLFHSNRVHWFSTVLQHSSLLAFTTLLFQDLSQKEATIYRRKEPTLITSKTRLWKFVICSRPISRNFFTEVRNPTTSLPLSAVLIFLSPTIMPIMIVTIEAFNK